MGGDTLGRLAWGLAQYEFTPPASIATPFWSAWYARFRSDWEASTPEGLALGMVALAELMPQAPPLEYRRCLIIAIR
jgi:hypothetical protein